MIKAELTDIQELGSNKLGTMLTGELHLSIYGDKEALKHEFMHIIINLWKVDPNMVLDAMCDAQCNLPEEDDL